MAKFWTLLTGIFENLENKVNSIKQYALEIPENPEILDFIPEILE
jgi:hypothetical protein